MSNLETILRRHGSEWEGYYAALANLIRHTPVYEAPASREFVCGAPDLCAWLLKHDAVTRPKLSFGTVLSALPLDDTERKQLATTTDAADRLLARSILYDRDAVAPDWFAWLSDLCNADALDRIAREHVSQIPRQDLYDFMQIGRSYVAEVACLVAGVRSAFARVHASPIAAVVDYMDSRADTLADAVRAAAGVKLIADELSAGAWNNSLPAPLCTDLPNRTVFLITAHESTAYLIVTACLMLKRTPDVATQEVVRAAADFDFPIQSVLRQTTEDLRWRDVHLPRNRRLRIHIGAAFGGGRQANRSFGIGRNTCPGAKLALAVAEAFVNNVRPLLPKTAFFEDAQDRYTSLAARTFRKLNASTDARHDCGPSFHRR
jgi:hypothetical protein